MEKHEYRFWRVRIIMFGGKKVFISNEENKNNSDNREAVIKIIFIGTISCGIFWYRPYVHADKFFLAYIILWVDYVLLEKS